MAAPAPKLTNCCHDIVESHILNRELLIADLKVNIASIER
jgi:hypothetical protein